MRTTEAADTPEMEDSRSVRRSAGRTSALALLVVAVLLAAAALLSSLAPAFATVPVALLVLPPAAFALAASLGLWWSDRRAHAAVVEDAQRQEDDPPAPGRSVTLTPRALDAYVRSLEATLAEQDERLHDCRRAGDLRREAEQQTQADRVRLTVRAMRGVLHDQPGDVALNRVERALDRLTEASPLTRPLLAAQPSGSVSVHFVVARDVVEAHRPAPVPAAPAVDPPEGRRADNAMLEEVCDLDDTMAAEASAAPSDTMPPKPQRVLPVPAPPVVAVRRRRTPRRLRRRAATSPVNRR